MLEKELKSTFGDAVHTGAKTLLSMIPVIGIPASEAFGMLITPPLEKRKEEWVKSVVDKLIELEEKFDTISLESLQANDQFITCLVNANALAIKTHSKEKLEALRNMVLNSSCLPTLDENMQIIYMSLINELSPWHIKILDFLNAPNLCFEKFNMQKPSYYTGSPMTLLRIAYPELATKPDLCNILVRDLYNKGLLTSDSINATMTEQGMWASRTSDIGKEFISYITSPL